MSWVWHYITYILNDFFLRGTLNTHIRRSLWLRPEHATVNHSDATVNIFLNFYKGILGPLVIWIRSLWSIALLCHYPTFLGLRILFYHAYHLWPHSIIIGFLLILTAESSPYYYCVLFRLSRSFIFRLTLQPTTSELVQHSPRQLTITCGVGNQSTLVQFRIDNLRLGSYY